jgi:hypothetical protein
VRSARSASEAGQAQRTRERPTAALVRRPGRAPDPPSGLLAASARLWEAFWRARREFRGERVVPGSMGQPRLNPLASRLKDLEATIRETEREFGMTPLSRLRSGIGVGQAALTAAKTNRAGARGG